MKNGFTLIELLAVIVIVGVIGVIVVPAVMKNIDASREASFKQLMNTVEQTTQLYVRNNKDDIEGIREVGNVVTITFQDLVDKEGLETPIIDARAKKEISLDTQINILVKQNNKYGVTVGEIQYVE